MTDIGRLKAKMASGPGLTFADERELCALYDAEIETLRAENERLKAELRERDNDLGCCENCFADFASEDDMVCMGDVYFCRKCHAEWKAGYDACEHEWVADEEDGLRVCNKCNGYDLNPDSAPTEGE